jgi:hypothetical protein
MTCQTLREAIVDVARRVEIGEGTLAAVECHVEHCASCAALMARERQLSLGLSALAESTSVEGASEAVGRRLRELFVERQPVNVAAGRLQRVVRRTVLLRRALAAAAAIVVLVAAAAWWRSARSAEPEGAVVWSVPPSTSTPTTEPMVDVATPSVSAATGRLNSGHRAARVRPRRVQAPRLAAATGFVGLPGAVGLPDFESGQIIRVEIPLTSLPTYGLEIVPDARDVPVQADVLVGQDGQARAIRLVNDVGRRR